MPTSSWAGSTLEDIAEEAEEQISQKSSTDRASFNALKLKVMAAKMRKKWSSQGELRRQGSYTTIEVELCSEGEVPHSEPQIEPVVDTGWADNKAALAAIFIHPFSVLLIFFPLGLLSEMHQWGATCTFWLNILALIPLAKILGDGTEELAASIKNDTISGLLSATLGNAVEMILSVQTLRKGLLDVVKATLLGSILSNNLLVLGTSFLLGGIVGSSSLVGKSHVIYDENFVPSRCTCEKEQIFSAKSALVNMAMQLLSCMTCALPTVFTLMDGNRHEEDAEARQKILEVSRISSIFIISSYVAYVLFQLVTHKRMLTIDEGSESDDDGDAGPSLGAMAAVLLMIGTSAMIAISSEMLVGAIDEFVEKSNISANFIGIILLPFAGNACEHASAIRFAVQDRPGLSLGIAVGSSTQMALFVVPFTVAMGWVLDQPMDLVFGTVNTSVMILSVLVALALVMDGRANWLKGFMLCTAYLFEAVLYWSMPSEVNVHHHGH